MPRPGLKVYSLRLPVKYVAFLDDMADGVFIYNRTHALKMILASLSHQWDDCKTDKQRVEFRKMFHISFLESEIHDLRNIKEEIKGDKQ